MKLHHKIILGSLAVTVAAALMVNFGQTRASGSSFVDLVVTILLISGIEIILGIIMLFHPNKQYAQGFLISGGIIFLIGFVTCTGGFHIT